MTTTLPYGSWPSIISAADVAGASPRFAGAAFVDGEVWWAEGVPAEGGRTAVFRDGATAPVLPAPWNARSRVHEYGGGAWVPGPDASVLFVEASDQRVWRWDLGASSPRPLTPRAGDVRHGGLVFEHGALLAVRERHADTPVPQRDIVRIPIDGSAEEDPDAIRSLVAGSDFVAQPRLHPSGTRLAWIAWDHPSMPWDEAQLRVGDVTTAGVESWSVVSATDATQAEWVGDELVFTDDPTGRWNLYRANGHARTAIAPADADTGGPLWSLGTRWFVPLDDGRIVAVRTNGSDEVVVISPDGSVRPLDLPLTSGVELAAVDGTQVLVFGASAMHTDGLWRFDVDDPRSLTSVRGGDAPWPLEWVPRARAVTFTGEHGDVHAFDYPPTNPRHSGPAAERAPYVVLAHGGPTAHVSGGLSASIAYLTSRGIGVLDVNYGGSTGYGRAYRERLRNVWGIADVDDVTTAARRLADDGRADRDRLAVKGGSAGGLTVLGSLVRGGTFRAGISRYGVADLRSLATDTHDFEARYLDGLVGRYPEDEAVYRERSPLTHADRIDVPVLILQGDADPVVPPAQSESIRDALAANGVAHRYVLFEGEGHGFRKRETIITVAETELAFLGAAFGFVPHDSPPLTLD